MNYKISIRYDGSLFYGWAKQPQKRTVQEHLETVFKTIFKINDIKIIGSGRTDRGVHAYEQVFSVNHHQLNYEPQVIYQALCSQIDPDVQILKVQSVHDTFHAQHDAISKTYQYIINDYEFDLFKHNYEYFIHQKINDQKLLEALELFVGEYDFKSFSTSELPLTTRKINWVKITRNTRLEIYINGNGFLKNMVRMIISACIDYVFNKISLTQIKTLLTNPKKGASVKLAPPCGLYLYKVYY
ncbi:tRNA pseudouridine(38-40) synthase TruA [Ureaplasma urealyticum]|uniref:tRNA pseudouridine synthase A n=3 Tax=Ureaplasma urealyticum TaxID=2130 RepID=TRUA_UREU1|nr:tRNA pseudouridine(38-40) synthase TruA [Ureaplasma urealyticum]B5ZC44.1 RecName: Full=tRNA pseudouridine synthase A; AltName: Full=tRNA pseudouridine(38-40) synthase; AltName: Full=tRNA pseudouridylate synthase I; AltName: Full=tRNA-uridine isomerase I [Ureaplasma urealyticum serovar 10 str. ATCC 33699]EDX53645.1 tRNA pseudouridine synthase A [Ureaplasma urealyticum serovar 9 str. ATCC 33175]ACI59955.1 tRNA pseudouridine synthase A [Ureaplasma urealyticum serovar 10 str. ATCC 33699]EDT49849